ncbi:putative Fluoroacetate dehalogenase [Venustampulla echinocandica]|uniref:Putative Fluoroacetate dehalogenase n=1 Tax=Venustampulla echinocandica TaxID=2656787 RepID=A0A370TJW2_9HELO|nr:putative Fluoroacetate dehalogenase [Venustampulla echinocandica]RDL35799.1 putative Fluoroacetate dehalogenase [Venustampulla echinocandica]
MEPAWDQDCITQSTADVDYMTSLGLQSNISTAAADKLFYYQRGISSLSGAVPILVLLHGYPQTWRHVIQRLPSDIPIFVPDLPGYGRSAPLSVPNNKHNAGQAILQTLRSIIPHKGIHPIILAGHDRSARICHRLSVDNQEPTGLPIKGTILLDIIPTIEQWSRMTNPGSIIRSFHWSLLANVEVATSMIKSQGGDVFTKMLFSRWAGRNPAGDATLQENDAVNVYANSFKYESVIRAACEDYRAGAQEDIQRQEQDQKDGRKLDVDTLLLYSAAYLGSSCDVKQVWEAWMGSGKLEGQAFEEGVGHFIAEEAPAAATLAIVSFYRSHY